MHISKDNSVSVGTMKRMCAAVAMSASAPTYGYSERKGSQNTFNKVWVLNAPEGRMYVKVITDKGKWVSAHVSTQDPRK